MSSLVTFVLVTIVQWTLIVSQRRLDGPWGIMRFDTQGNGSRAVMFTLKLKKSTDCIFLQDIYMNKEIKVLVNGVEKRFQGQFRKKLFVCDETDVRIRIEGPEDSSASIFYRILDVGEYPAAYKEDICRGQRTCSYNRDEEKDESKFLLLTSPIEKQTVIEKVIFTHELGLRNDTIALLDLDPERIGLIEKDVLDFHECEKNETLFHINTTSLTRRTIFKHFGSDLCITYFSERDPGISNFVIPGQLVQLFLSLRESKSGTSYFNVERRNQTSVDVLVLKGDEQIQRATSSYLCHFAQLEISEAEDNLLLVSKSQDLRTNISLEVTRTDGGDDIYVGITAFDIYVAVFQNIKWAAQLPTTKSLSTYVAGIGCEQRGDAVKSADDRYNSGAVFCVYVKTRTMQNSDDDSEQNLWAQIKERIKDYIFNITNSASFVERTAVVLRSREQIEIPRNNPVVHATREMALVRLAFVIVKDEKNTPALTQKHHYEILEEFEHQHEPDESFSLAPRCHVEISLARNLIFFGLLVLTCTVIFGTVWRCQLNADVQRRVIAQMSEEKRRRSDADWWDCRTSELIEEGSPTNSQEQYANQAFIPDADAQVNDPVIRSKLKGTSLAMKSFRRSDLASRSIWDGGLPLSVPGGMGGQMSQIREEDETIGTSRM